MSKQLKSIFLFLVFLLSNVAFAGNYYFKAGTDNKWSNKNNWYSNSSCTTKAVRAPLNDATAIVYIPAGQTVQLDAGLTAIGSTSNPLAGSGYGINIQKLVVKEGATVVQSVSRVAISLPYNGSMTFDGDLTLASGGEFFVASTSPSNPQVPVIEFNGEVSLSGSKPCQIYLPFSDNSESVWYTDGLDAYRGAYPSAVHLDSRASTNTGEFVYNASNGNWDEWNNWIVNDYAEGIFLAKQGTGYYPGFASSDFTPSSDYAQRDEVVIPASSSVRLVLGNVVAKSVTLDGELTFALPTSGLEPSVSIEGYGKLWVSDPAQAVADNVAQFVDYGGEIAFYCESSNATSFNASNNTYANLHITPDGDLEVLSGTLVISGDATIDGKITLADGASLQIDGALHTAGTGSISCSNASQVVVAGGSSSFEAEGGKLVVGSGSSDAPTEYSGGSGTELDPFVITTLADLNHLAEKANSGAYDDDLTYFVLGADIVANSSLIGPGGSPASGASVWTPIGGSAHKPALHFAGAGHSVSGLYVPVGSSNVGLFGALGSGSEISNLSVEDSYFVGQNNVGGVVGDAGNAYLSGVSFSGQVSGVSRVGGVAGAASGTLSQCSVRGSVSGSSSAIGGVVGYAEDATLTKNVNAATVSAYAASTVGGVAGSALNSSLSYNVNEGAVFGKNNVGGVVGTADHGDDKNDISGNINVAEVHGSANVGGVVGSLANTYGRTVSAVGNENFGNVEGSSATGGIVGLAAAGSTISRNVNVGNVSGQGAIIGSAPGGTSSVSSNYYDVQVSTTPGAVAGSDVAGVAEAATTAQLTSGSFVGSPYLTEVAGLYPLPAQAPMDDEIRLAAAAVVLNSAGGAPETLGSISSDFSVSAAPGYVWTQSGDKLSIAADGSVTVNGKGDMTLSVTYGTASKSYHLSINVFDNCVVTLVDYPDAFFIYRGEPVRPAVASVKVGLRVIDPSQYVVEYDHNNGLGTATARISPAPGATFEGSGSVTFEIVDVPLVSFGSLRLDPVSVVYNGCVQRPEALVLLDADEVADVWPEAAGHDVFIRTGYTINNGVKDYVYNNIYTVSFTGDFTSAGSSNVVSAKSASTSSLALAVYEEGGVEYTKEVRIPANASVGGAFSIAAKELNLDDFVVTLTPESYLYDGNSHEPAVSVSFSDCNGASKVVPASDYTVAYSNNVQPSSEAKVVITGRGNLSGSITKNFSITNPSLVGATFDYDDAPTYTGLPVEPEVTGGTSASGVSLSYDDFEIVRYENNVEPTTDDSKAIIVVRGRGNYSDEEVSLEFDILPASVSGIKVVGMPTGTKYFTGESQKPDIKLMFNGIELTEDQCQISWSTDDFVNVDDIWLTLVGVKPYFKDSRLKGSFSIQEVPFKLSYITVDPIPDQVYDGTAKKPEPVLRLGSYVLVKGTDYTVSYSNYTNVGLASISIKGKGPNFSTATIPATFNIVSADISSATVTGLDGSYVFTSAPIEPNVVVSLLGKTLERGTDYVLDLPDEHTNAGTVTFSIVGQGKYQGTLDGLSYTIKPAQLSDCQFASLGNVTYTGSACLPSSDPQVNLGFYTLQEGIDYSVSYTNNINAGNAVATYNALSANFDGSYVQNYTIDKASISAAVVSDIAESYPFTGSAITPVPALSFNGNVVPASQYTLSYVDNIAIGTNAQVTISAADNGNFYGSVTKTFAILAIRLDDATAEPVAPVTYTGHAITPEPGLYVLAGSERVYLTKDVDYEYQYDNNVNACDNAAVIRFVGKGAYAGSKEVTFTIAPVNFARQGSVNHTLTPSEFTYSGSAFTPEPVITLGDITLANGVDYVLDYENNVNFGTPNVVVSAKSSNFTGSFKIPFTIEKANLADVTLELSVPASDIVYTGLDVTPAFTVTFNGQTVADNQYFATFTENRNASTDAVPAVLTLTPKQSSNFTGSKSLTFKVLPCPISSLVASAIPAQSYAAKAIEPTLEIKANVAGAEIALSEGHDYSVEFANNVNAGTATVTVTGVGNYSGSRDLFFTINPVDLANAGGRVVMDVIPSYKYSGAAIEPVAESVIRLDGSPLTKDVDYTLTYLNNVNPGTATVTYTAKSFNFTGSVSTSFEITKVPLADAVVSGVESIYAYTGKAITPTPVLSFSGSVVPTSDYDYTISNNTEPGSAIITFTAKPSSIYEGKLEYRFLISAIDLSDVIVEGLQASYVFTYGEIKPRPTVKINFNGSTRTLVAGTDFNFIYDNNVNVTTADSKAVVSVVGNASPTYINRADFSFDITPKSIADADISTAAKATVIASLPYTGGEVLQTHYVLKYNGKTLVEGGKDDDGGDFYVTYANNISVGTATINFVGKNNFSGSFSKTYTITGASFEDAIITIEDVCAYTSWPLTPEPKVVHNGNLLVKDVDYRISGYANNTDVGSSASVTLQGLGAYAGSSRTVKFDIIKGSLTDNPNIYYKPSGASAYGQIADQYYTGKAITPGGGDFNNPQILVFIRVKNGAGSEDKRLIYNSEDKYDVRYSHVNNVNAGTGYYVVSAAASCWWINSYQVPFRILPVDLSDNGTSVTFSERGKSYTYTGKPISFGVNTLTIKNKKGEAVLVSEEDVEIANTLEPGTATVSVRGRDGGSGNFVGVRTFSITITKADISNVVVTNIDDVVVNGVDPIVMYNDLLVDPSEYNVTSRTATNITIQAKASSPHFTGSKTINSNRVIDLSARTLVKTTQPVHNDEELGFVRSGQTATDWVEKSSTKREVRVIATYYNEYTVISERVINETGVSTVNSVDSYDEQYDAYAAIVSSTLYYNGSAQTPAISVSKSTTTVRHKSTVTEVKSVERSYTERRTLVYRIRLNKSGGKEQGTATTQSDNTVQVNYSERVLSSNLSDPVNSIEESSASTGTALRNDTDYKIVSYSNNINASKEAVVTVVGIGNYTNSISSFFEIKPVNLNKVTWGTTLSMGGSSVNSTGSGEGVTTGMFTLYDFLKEQVGYDLYLGGLRTNHPSFSLSAKLNGKDTRLYGCFDGCANNCFVGSDEVMPCDGHDFVFSYENCNVVSNNAKIVIKACPENPNYIGETRVTYKIQKPNLTWFTPSLNPNKFEWTGFAVKPNFVLIHDVSGWTVPRVVNGLPNYVCFYMDPSGKYLSEPVNVGTYSVGAYSTNSAKLGGSLKAGQSLNDGDVVSSRLTAFDGTPIYNVSTGAQNFEIIPASVDKLDISEIDPVVFNWTHVAPVPSISLSSKDENGADQTYHFVLDKDYSCTQNTSGVQTPGTYQAIITFGDCVGGAIVSRDFEVIPAKLQDVYAAGTLKVTLPEQTYDGSPMTPLPEIVFTDPNGGQHSLISSADDTQNVSLEYFNNVNACSLGAPNCAFVRITGNGSRFEGSIDVPFPIAKANFGTVVAVGADSYISQWSCGGLQFPTVSFEDPTSGETVDESEYYRVTSRLTGTVGQKAIVQYKANDKNYTGTRNVEVTITNLAIRSNDPNVRVVFPDVENLYYNGSAHTPEFHVYYVYGDGGQSCELAQGDCFKASDVSYMNNVEASFDGNKASVTINFSGNCTGTYTAEFEIKSVLLPEPPPGGSVTIDPVASADFTGMPVEPSVAPVIRYNGTALVAGTDYLVSFSNNTRAGSEALVNFTGLSKNFSGTVGANFTINKANIADAEQRAVILSEYEYTGADIKPVPTYLYGSYLLEEDYDYSLTYTNTGNIGPAKIIVTPLDGGNFTGDPVEIPYTILGRNFYLSRITDIPDQVCSGLALEPDFDVIFTINGTEITLRKDVDYDYSYENNVWPGTATLHVVGKGEYNGTFTKTFNISAINLATDALVTVDDIPVQSYVSGERVVLSPEPKIYYAGAAIDASLYSVSYQNNDKPGTATITFSALAGDGHASRFINSRSVGFTIGRPSFSGAEIEDLGEFYFNGEVQLPQPVVKIGEVVIDPVNYTVSYTPQNPKNVGTYRCVVDARGTIYEGSLFREFSILPLSIEGAKTSDIPVQDATGNAVRPAVVVTYPFSEGSVAYLTQGVDYDLDYENNVSAGTAYVVLTGKGNYSGVKRVPFSISRVSLAPSNALVVVAPIASVTYTGSPVRPKSSPVIYYNSRRLALGTDYTLEYDDAVNVGTAHVTFKGAGNYVDERTAEFEITPADLSRATVTLDKKSYPFTGSEVKPVLTVTFGGKTLVEGKDFTIAPVPTGANVQRGVGSLTLRAVADGNFTGQKVVSFTITYATISDCDVDIKEFVTYDGTEQTPAVSVVATINGAQKTLVQGTDYDLYFNNNINRGTAKATIVGKDNYAGSQKIANFEIRPLDLSSELISISNLESRIYTGLQVAPEPTVIFSNGENEYTLRKGATNDYTVTFGTNVNAGDATVTITSSGSATSNFTGSRVEHFDIGQANIVECVVSGLDETYGFTGLQITPAPLALALRGVEVSADDYSVLYGANVNVGVNSGSVTFHSDGTGNFLEGDKTVNFNIGAMSLSAAVISGVEDKVFNAQKQTQSGYSVKLGDVILTEGVDFTVSYDGGCTNVSDKSALVITGKGNYTGTARQAFQIKPMDISSELISVSGLADALYTGSPIQPSVVVNFGARRLGRYTDYNVKYSDNTNAGTATVTISAVEGDGKNYYGSRTVQFAIGTVSIADANVVGILKSYPYTGSQIAPTGATVSYNNKIQTSGYELVYGENVSPSAKGTVTFTAVAGGNFTPGTTKTVEFDITAVPLRTFAIGAFNFTGEEIRPEGFSGSFVSSGVTHEVQAGRDFEIVAYRNNTNVGTAYVDIRGINGYSGEASVTFQITTANLTASLPWNTVSYNGSVQVPEPIVRDANNNEMVLVRNVDYTVRYSVNDSKSAGSYTVTVTGTGNYSSLSKVTLGYVIEKAALTVAGGSFSLTYGDDAPALLYNVTGLLGSDTEATALSSVRVTCDYQKWSPVGTYPVNVSAASSANYVVSRRSGAITVVPRDIAEADAADIVDPVYCGTELRPDIVLSYGGMELYEGVDYSLTISDNVNIGTASVVVTGVGNFTGTKSLSFNVLPTDYTWRGLVDGDWFTADNWAGGSVPDANSDVLIFAGATNEPHVASAENVAVAKSVNVAGGSLTVEDFGRLFVSNDVIVGTDAKLVLNQRYDKMPSLCANSVIDAGGNIVSDVEVNRTLVPFVMYYLGSVTTEGTVESGIGEYDYCSAYSPVSETYTNYADFTSAPTFGFSVGVGSFDDEATITQVGSLMSRQNVKFALQNRERRDTDAEGITDYGWNLLSNPYPFSLPMDADFFNFGQNVDPVVWFPCYDYDNDVNRFKTYNLLLNVSVGSDYSDSDPGSDIPSGQAFFVRKNGTDRASFEITPKALSASDFAETSKLKSTQVYGDVLRLTVSSPGSNTDEVALVFRDGGSESPVYGDATKMQNEAFMNEIAVRKGNQSLSIPFMPSIKALTSEIPLVVRAASSANRITISASNIDLFDDDVEVYLVDKQKNRKLDLHTISSYTVSVTAGQVFEDRFAIELVDNRTEEQLNKIDVLTPLAPVAQDVQARIWKSGNGSVMVESSEAATLRICDLSGRVVASFPIAKGVSRIETGLQLNLYVFMLDTQSGVSVRKMF